MQTRRGLARVGNGASVEDNDEWATQSPEAEACRFRDNGGEPALRFNDRLQCLKVPRWSPEKESRER